MNAAAVPTATAAHLGACAVSGGGLPEGMASIGWLQTQNASTQLALPSDLFMVTAGCEIGMGGATDGAGVGATPPVAITLLRTRAERFQPRGRAGLVFALLTPLGLLRLLRAPLDGSTDGRIDAAAFCSPTEQGALRAALLDAGTHQRRVQRFGQWLEDRCRRRHCWQAPQQRAADAAAAVAQDAGPLDLEALRARLGVSRRQQERDLRRWLGVSLTAYARLVRFQRAAGDIAAGSALVDAAADHCFADQPHLTRTFRALCAMTPRELALRAAPASRVLERRVLAGRVVVLDAP